MKKTAYYYFSLVALVAGGLISCQDDDMGYTKEEIAYSKFEKEYNENFERDYGKIAPGHTWGFGESTETRATRTGETGYYRIVPQNGSYNIEHEYGANVSDDKTYAFEHYPGPITELEQDYVWSYLQAHPNQGATTCDLGSYYLQNLGINEHNYTADDGRTIDNKHMDQIWFDNYHFQSYNNGVGYDYYVTNSTIRNPKYHESYGQDWKTTNYRFYYIPAGTKNGYNFPGGLYLCFDYETINSQNGKVRGDGIYDDWVIKVCPGEGEIYGNQYRVFCEDLGDAWDLDFNDLVFDYIEMGPNIYGIHVIGLAGTLPITFVNIDGNNNNKVVRPEGDDNIRLHVDLDVFYVNRAILSQDLILVKGNKQHFPTIFTNNGNGNINNYGKCFLYNEPGKAPYMIRVPVGTEWPDEGERIEHKYSNFPEYVVDPWSNPEWWTRITQ